LHPRAFFHDPLELLEPRMSGPPSLRFGFERRDGAYVVEHLEHMNELENSGRLFASGPFIQEGVLVGDGLTILNTSTLDEARALILAEPLVKRGFREFQLHTWELREGRMMVTLNASTSNFGFQ
jgi:uncharacterized protein YciI